MASTALDYMFMRLVSSDLNLLVSLNATPARQSTNRIAMFAFILIIGGGGW
jgi:hypothetical protein